MLERGVDMEFFDLVKVRRSIRKYQNRQIEREDLEKIIEAGLYAPNAGGGQRTMIVAIHNKGLLSLIHISVGTIEQAGEQPLPSCLCRAAFVCPQFLYPLEYLFFNNCRLRVGKDTVIFRRILQTLFQLVGFGVGLEIDRTPGIFRTFQYPRYGFVIPTIEIIRHRLSVTLCIVGFDCQHPVSYTHLLSIRLKMY